MEVGGAPCFQCGIIAQFLTEPGWLPGEGHGWKWRMVTQELAGAGEGGERGGGILQPAGQSYPRSMGNVRI